mgnify:CR=1 FL=1
MEQDITCKKEKELFFSYLGSLGLGVLLLLLIAFLYFYIFIIIIKRRKFMKLL